MTRWKPPARAVAGLLFLVAFSACSGLRSSQHPKPAPIPASTAAEPSAAEAPAATAAPDSSQAQPSAAVIPTAACSCADDSKSKPKPKPRPVHRPVRKEAPPQLPTAPIVAATPSGGVVESEIKQMNVSVMSILGKRVQGAHGEDLGRVVDVLADATGRVRVAIIDFGGFLGVGNHRIAVDWPLLRFNPDAGDASLLLSIKLEKLQAAPEYRDNARPQTLMEPAPPQITAPTPPTLTPDSSKK